jgi:hypothetical protein
VAEADALDTYATDAQRSHLRGWLEYAASTERRQRRSAGISGVFAGTPAVSRTFVGAQVGTTF